MMLLYELFKHQLKEKMRSSFWQKSILLNIFLGMIGVYLLLNIIAISFFADKVIVNLYKGQDVVVSFTRMLFYYFSIDLIVRFLIQELPALAIQPYLILPINKSKLLHYPLLRSVTSFFNVLAFLLVLPFFIKNICFSHSLRFCATWFVTILSIVGINNFVNFFIKKSFAKRPFVALVLICIFGIIFYLDISGIYSVSVFFSKVVFFIANNSYLVIIPLFIGTFSYLLAYNLLRRNAYIEDVRHGTVRKSMGLSFFDQFGEIGQLITLEIKLILRNKRPSLNYS